MPDQIVDSLHGAYRGGVRMDYIVTGRSRLLGALPAARIVVYVNACALAGAALAAIEQLGEPNGIL